MSQVIPGSTSAANHTFNSIYGIQGTNPDDAPSYTVVDSEVALSEMVDTLVGLPVNPPSIYADLEGINLSRQGTISILQLYVLPKDHTYLVDVHQLQDKTFTTLGMNSDTCLKTILEKKDIPKVFFDVRNDSDALFHHFQVRLSGVHDLQLMEYITRPSPGKCVNGLQRCIEYDAMMTNAESRAWIADKEKGVKLFAPEKGGRHEVFNDRPLAEEIIRYCVQDVQLLPRLWSHYIKKMTVPKAAKVLKATEERVSDSQSKDYVGHGKHKALAPAGWYTAPVRRGQGWGSAYFDDY
jgi:exonuclease 3'-5' domain-containing protein 1